MRNRTITNCRKMAAVIAGALLVLLTLASAFYLSSESGHICSDDHCPICENILECSNVLRQVGGAFVPHVIGIVFFLTEVLVRRNILSIFSQESLISKKVRMND